MSSMYIREYASMPMMNGNMIGVGEEDGLRTDQKITFTGTAGVSLAVGADTRWVRVHVDGIASIKVGPGTGSSPGDVTTSAARMVAGATEYFGIIPGYRIAAITNT